jgi:ABC-2 type transport system ATP-binding protein
MSKVVLRTDGITKSYGSLVAVNNLSLEVYEGEILGFLGPNGAGKTTSIDMMCGLLKPDRGQVLIHGLPVERGAAELRRRIGACPQEVVLWERLTCMEQLLFMGQMYGMSRPLVTSRAEKLLGEFELEGKKNAQARTLSGGMQRRLNLAMALIHDPEILLLDEPEVGLDPQGRVSFRNHIRSLARAKTIILTTHNMDEADRLADRVAIIDHGELLVLDTPEALKRSVGEGDVLEMTLEGQDADNDRLITSLKKVSNKATFHFAEETLIVRAARVVRLISDIVEILEKEGMKTSDVRLRETTLEDVFIHLTGRRLRE